MESSATGASCIIEGICIEEGRFSGMSSELSGVYVFGCLKLCGDSRGSGGNGVVARVL